MFMSALESDFAATGPIQDRISRVLQQLEGAVADSGRAPGAVRLLAVSKGRHGREVLDAIACGLDDFAENYAQEFSAKADFVSGNAAHMPCWHFIGSLQANKTKLVANRCAWVHAIDRGRIAERLHAQRDQGLEPLNVCLQVNIDGDPNKSGATPEGLRGLAESVLALPRLRLRGLMAMPALHGDRRAAYARTRACMERLCEDLSVSMDTLSMGTSSDFVDAIREGATMVRIGTALFGPRPGSVASNPGDGAALEGGGGNV